MPKPLFYKWSFQRRLFKYSSPLIQLFEKPKILKYGDRDAEAAPCFIIGLPRSGSTILYQLLTAIFDISYFDNLMNLGRENIYFSAWLSSRKFGSKPHHCFSSKYGNTNDGGLHAPSEFGQFWYKWIPEDLVEIDAEAISEDKKKELRLTIHSLINRYRKPFLIKNLFSLMRIELIKEIFPNAKFIIIQRDPLYIAQSIYLARKANTTNPQEEWWSVPIPGYKKLKKQSLAKQVAKQVVVLQGILQKTKQNLAPEDVLEINYEDIKVKELNSLLSDFLGARTRKNIDIESIKFIPKNKQIVEDEVFNELQSELNSLVNY